MKRINYLTARRNAILVALLFINFTFAQNSPQWKLPLKDGLSWQRVTNNGNLLICNNSGLSAVNTKTGAILWTQKDLANVPESEYQEIVNSPFVSVSKNGSKGSEVYILEPFEGTIVFSSKEAGMERVINKYFLYKNGGIFVLGYKPGKNNPSMAMVDMKTGKTIWSKDSDFGLASDCVESGKDEFLISTVFFLYKINAQTGNEIWKKSLNPQYAAFGSFMTMLDKGGANAFKPSDLKAQIILTPLKPNAVFVVAESENKKETTNMQTKATTVEVTYTTSYIGFNLGSGDFLWKNIVEFSGKMGYTTATEYGLVDGREKINLMDYDSGNKLWGKKGRGINVKGDAVRTLAIVGKNVLINSGNRDKNNYYSKSYLNIVNPATADIYFEKYADIKGEVLYTEELPQGLLIATDKEINVLNITTGNWLWDDGIRGGANILYSGNDKFYAFDLKEKSLYEMDRKTMDKKKISSEPIEFKGSEEPTSIEVRDKGVLLISDQNVAMVDFSGKVTFNNYYPAPRESSWKTALLIANAAHAAMSATACAVYGGMMDATSESIKVKNTDDAIAKEATGQIGKDLDNAAMMGAAYAQNYLQQANMRYKASSKSNNTIYILTQSDKNTALIQVNKDSGQIVSTINLNKDKTPLYSLDIIDNKVYYFRTTEVSRNNWESNLECY